MKNPLRPALFRFLQDLAQNNERSWFEANKARFEGDFRTPALEWIEDMAAPLARLSAHFEAEARKVGGSLFRIQRDTRFSKDKSPYKTNGGIQFRHAAGRDAHAPCFYLHLDPAGCFVGAGIWRPDTRTAGKIRRAIDADPGGWKKALGGKRFRAEFELSGDSLKRPPSGFDKQHPLLEDLKRKDFIAVRKLSRGEVTAPDFTRSFAAHCRTAAPLVRFLCAALELPY